MYVHLIGVSVTGNLCGSFDCAHFLNKLNILKYVHVGLKKFTAPFFFPGKVKCDLQKPLRILLCLI